jgi:hypothetical protein
MGTPVCRLSRRTGRSVSTLMILGILVGLLVLPIGASDVVLQLRPTSSVSGVTTWATLAGATTTAGAGTCTTTLKGLVPGVSAPARAVVYLNESARCPSRTPFTLLPALRFGNGLLVPSGHVLAVSVALTSVGGTVTMLRTLRVYVQQVGGGNPILSTTDGTLRRGAITVATTSLNALPATGTYGIGVTMTLQRPFVPGTATLSMVLQFALDDGGVLRGTVQESASFVITY